MQIKRTEYVTLVNYKVVVCLPYPTLLILYSTIVYTLLYSPLLCSTALNSYLNDTAALEAVVDKFAEIIQSGKPVVLDRFTTFSVVGHKPPPKFFLFLILWEVVALTI